MPDDAPASTSRSTTSSNSASSAAAKGDVVEAPPASDDVVREARRVSGDLEDQERRGLAVAVGERSHAPERRTGGVVDGDEAQAEHVLVEPAEPIQVGGVHPDVAEPCACPSRRRSRPVRGLVGHDVPLSARRCRQPIVLLGAPRRYR